MPSGGFLSYQNLLAVLDIHAGHCGVGNAAAGEVVDGVVLGQGGGGDKVDARRGVFAGNGVERLFFRKLIAAVGSPVEAHAHEAEHVVVGVVVAVLLVVHAERAVGQYQGGGLITACLSGSTSLLPFQLLSSLFESEETDQQYGKGGLEARQRKRKIRRAIPVFLRVKIFC